MEKTTPARAGRREWIGLGVLALPTVVLSMDLTVLHLAAPTLSADLDPTGSQLLWILDVYGFMVASFLLVMGSLGDRIGRRRLLFIGAAAFAAASVLAAFAPTVETLIAARALLGVAGATLMPSTLALLTNMFHTSAQRTFAIAVWMTCFTAGEAIGPLIGGALLELFWWGSIFLIGVPVMALLLAVGPFVLPESSERLPGRLDMVSATLLIASVLPLVYAVKKLALSGVGLEPIGWAVLGLAVGAVFCRRQLRMDDPMMDLRLFRLPAFSAGLTTQVIAVAAMAGSQLLVLQYLQSVLELSPFQAGLWTVPSIVLGIIATLLAPKMVTRIRPAKVVGVCLAIAAVGSGMLAVTAPMQSLPAAIIGFTVLYTGVTPTLALITDLIVSSAPEERSGMASGVAESGGEFGLASGMAFLGAATMAVYQVRLTEAAPAGVDEGSLDAAQETVGAGVRIAEETTGATGAALLEAVHAAYSDGLQVAAGAGAVLLAVGAVLALGFLRGAPASAEQAGDSASPAEPKSTAGATTEH
ncbi:MFS transporter [Nocardiopsis suaedae]|uniref:MFS transporter n=1 Tax=Nocardiopsis suaedae TaxID=3018444 RepID=A0ABT4TRG7_9ACTN|nr:MFS transporter [Nocardiopsis suaedae]MDA2806976.1 MFS transporter [Nocardiopsis suaedae]